jgi:penicillin-binding protein-related factor A (putative recombinase)
MKLKLTEKQIQDSIMRYLALNFRSTGFFWVNKTQGTFDPVKKVFRSGTTYKGISDILGILYGKFIAIEVKSATGRLRPEQKAFLEKINRMGGIAFEARSIDDVDARLRQWEGMRYDQV